MTGKKAEAQKPKTKVKKRSVTKRKLVKTTWVTQAQFSRIHAWDAKYTRELIADGVIALHRNKKLDLDEANAAVADWRPDLYQPSEVEKEATKEIEEKKESKPTTFSEAKTKREKLRVEDLQMDVDLKKSILCRQVDEENKGYAAAQRAKDSLFSIADRLSARLAAEDDVHKIREILNKQFTKICLELAGGR